MQFKFYVWMSPIYFEYWMSYTTIFFYVSYAVWIFDLNIFCVICFFCMNASSTIHVFYLHISYIIWVFFVT